MHVFRVFRVLIPVAIVLVVVAGVASLLSARPDLQRAKRGVDRAWTPVASGLGGHYLLLARADDKVRNVPGAARSIADEVGSAIGRWQSATTGHDVAAQVRAANELEALGRRLVQSARVSHRVQENAPAKDAVEAYAADPGYAATDVATAVTTFNRAVAAYEEQRNGPVRSVVANVLGDDEIPAFARIPTPI